MNPRLLLFLLTVTTLGAPASSARAQSAGMPPLPILEPSALYPLEWRFWVYYHLSLQGDLRIPQFGDFCNADQGDFCLEGDWESNCILLRCHSVEEQARFVSEMAELAREYPRSPSAVGQAVYAAIRIRRWNMAEELLEVCAPDGAWWCHLLRGYVLHRTHRSAEAEEPLRRGLEAAPGEIRCRLEDIYFLLPGEVRDRYDALPCSERGPFLSHFWWLADPFHVDPGNDRWAEHIARRFELLFHEQRLQAIRAGGGRPRIHTRGHERYYVLRGPPDSWVGAPLELGLRTSRGAASTHYVPEALPLEGLDGPLTYQLRAGELDEGYTRWEGPTSELPAQVARFREGDSLQVALASDLSELGLWTVGGPGEAGEGGSTTARRTLPFGRMHFVASEAPDHLAALDPRPITQEATFAALLANRPQLVGFEVLSPDGTARHRRSLAPLPSTDPAISDLLLYRPVGRTLPETRMQAVGLMLSRMYASSDSPLGIYWEAYGIHPEDEIEFTLRLVSRGRGFLGRLKDVVRLTGREVRSLTWKEPAGEGAPLQRAINLQLVGVDDGDYELILEMGLPEGTALSRSARMEVVSGG